MSDSWDHANRHELPLSDTDGQHFQLLVNGINKILNTKGAETTYAQIIDGLPLQKVAHAGNNGLTEDHPLFGMHEVLCPGVLEETRALRNSLNIGDLKVDAELLLQYKAVPPHSRFFKIRFLELTAVYVHQIAVMLYHIGSTRHSSHSYHDWAPPRLHPEEPPEDDGHWAWRQWPESGHPPSLFYHPWFVDYQDYPYGKADVVGYWAEARILGGVFLFDRRPEDGDQEALYSHSDRGGITYRIWKLHPWQKTDLYAWLTSHISEESDGKCPLPVLADDTNIERLDPEEPILETGIYRDPWERRMRKVIQHHDKRLEKRWNSLDWVTDEDKLTSLHNAHARLWKDREEQDAEEEEEAKDEERCQ